MGSGNLDQVNQGNVGSTMNTGGSQSGYRNQYYESGGRGNHNNRQNNGNNNGNSGQNSDMPNMYYNFSQTNNQGWQGKSNFYNNSSNNLN